MNKVHILLIEDNPADVELLRRACVAARLDCRFTVLDDGAEALKFVRSFETQPDEPCPDLIVLDLNIPKNDGVEVLQAIRGSGCFAEVPVAVLSSSASPRDRAKMEQFRIGRYITKPADLDQFLRIGVTLKELLTENTARLNRPL